MPGLKPCGIALFPLSLMRSGLRRRARIKIRFHRREKCRNVQNVSPHVDTKRVVEEHREIESTFRARGKSQNPIFQKFQISKILRGKPNSEKWGFCKNYVFGTKMFFEKRCLFLEDEPEPDSTLNPPLAHPTCPSAPATLL